MVPCPAPQDPEVAILVEVVVAILPSVTAQVVQPGGADVVRSDWGGGDMVIAVASDPLQSDRLGLLDGVVA